MLPISSYRFIGAFLSFSLAFAEFPQNEHSYNVLQDDLFLTVAMANRGAWYGARNGFVPAGSVVLSASLHGTNRVFYMKNRKPKSLNPYARLRTMTDDEILKEFPTQDGIRSLLRTARDAAIRNNVDLRSFLDLSDLAQKYLPHMSPSATLRFIRLKWGGEVVAPIIVSAPTATTQYRIEGTGRRNLRDFNHGPTEPVAFRRAPVDGSASLAKEAKILDTLFQGDEKGVRSRLVNRKDLSINTHWNDDRDFAVLTFKLYSAVTRHEEDLIAFAMIVPEVSGIQGFSILEAGRVESLPKDVKEIISKANTHHKSKKQTYVPATWPPMDIDAFVAAAHYLHSHEESLNLYSELVRKFRIDTVYLKDALVFMGINEKVANSLHKNYLKKGTLKPNSGGRQRRSA